MNEKKPFGAYIRKKRLELGLTQKELAEQLFVTESTVSKWERALSYPDVSMVTSICAALHITEHEFFTACDDDQAHSQELAAKRWRRMVTVARRFFAAGYVIALVTCFFCNLGISNTLNWFWIVLASVALGFCFTNLPFLVRRNKVTVCLGAASGCLILLLLSCWVYAGGLWIIGGMVITAACLVLPWGWWAIWRFYGKHVWPLCMGLLTVWVFFLLAVIWVFKGGDWLFSLALPLAAAGAALLWAGLAVVWWLPVGWCLKGGLIVLLSGLGSAAINSLCDLLIDKTIRVRFWDYFFVTAMLARRSAGELSWVNMLIFQIELVCSIALIMIGVVIEIRRRKRI